MVPADGVPPAEVPVDGGLVRALLDAQVPELAGLDIVEVANGWDNVIFRVGDCHAVRLPRRAVAAGLVDHEHRWLPVLAPALPLPIPAPVHLGRPDAGYPWAWSVCPWLPGRLALATPPADPAAAAERLGAFLAALHRPAPADAPANPFRGIPLAGRDGLFRDGVAFLGDRVDGPELLARWRDVLDVAEWAGPPLWIHGDLHPANVLVHRGEVSAVIDFGDLTAGDPATDLAVAWMLLPSAARPALREAAGAERAVDDSTWARAEGWALAFAVMFLANAGVTRDFADLGTRLLVDLTG